MLSVMTLVDSTEHLAQARASMLKQSHREWEWVVIPLAGVDVARDFGTDARIRVLAPPSFVASQGLAACKEFAFEQATASHVIELDQHDYFATDAVATIAARLEAADADVLYSDFANIPVNGPPRGYHPDYGWETYGIDVDGENRVAIRAFDPVASALSDASYAPSHGLTWRRDTYVSVGGHDPVLGNADTFDMVCRAYLSGATFEHIPHCLVCSRLHALRDRNLAVEQDLSNKYVYDIVREWARRGDLKSLDLGAAHNPAPGFVSVDLHDADINCDIRFGLPLDDNSVGCIRAFDFLEHMNHCPDSTCAHGTDGGPRCVVGMMNEFYRVLAPGGWLVSRTPSTDGRGAFQDPTHTSFWNPNSFWYYTRREQADFVPGVQCRFQANRLWQAYPTAWHEENHILYVHADLVALKGQRQPGLCEI